MLRAGCKARFHLSSWLVPKLSNRDSGPFLAKLHEQRRGLYLAHSGCAEGWPLAQTATERYSTRLGMTQRPGMFQNSVRMQSNHLRGCPAGCLVILEIKTLGASLAKCSTWLVEGRDLSATNCAGVLLAFFVMELKNRRISITSNPILAMKRHHTARHVA